MRQCGISCWQQAGLGTGFLQYCGCWCVQVGPLRRCPDFRKILAGLHGSDRWQRWRLLFQRYRLPWGILLACAQLPQQQLHLHPFFVFVELQCGRDDAESGLLEHTLGYGESGERMALPQHGASMTLFYWYFPEHRQLAESVAGDPKLILFPMGDASSYLPGNYTLSYGMWDPGFMVVSKDLSSLAPAVDSFVSKVNVTIEQMTEIVRQHKQLSSNIAQFDESDEMYSLACDWLNNNPDSLELWLVTTSTTTGQTTSTTDATTAGIAITTGQATSTGTQHDIDHIDITAAMGSRNVLDAFLFSMLCLKAAGMSI